MHRVRWRLSFSWLYWLLTQCCCQLAWRWSSPSTSRQISILDIANGARGKIVKIVLHDVETAFSPMEPVVHLRFPPAYVVIKMIGTKVSQLEGLDTGEIPLMLSERSFSIQIRNEKRTVVRTQLLLTPAFEIYRLPFAGSNDLKHYYWHCHASIRITHPVQHICLFISLSWPRKHTFTSRLWWNIAYEPS